MLINWHGYCKRLRVVVLIVTKYIQWEGLNWEKALTDNFVLAKGLNIANGEVTFKAVVEAFGLVFTASDGILY